MSLNFPVVLRDRGALLSTKGIAIPSLQKMASTHVGQTQALLGQKSVKTKGRLDNPAGSGGLESTYNKVRWKMRVRALCRKLENKELRRAGEKQMGKKYQTLDQCTLKCKFVLNSDWLSVHTCGNLHPKINT